MSEDEKQQTIDFLLNKVKMLELDIQYELHLRTELEKKFQELNNIVKKFNLDTMAYS